MLQYFCYITKNMLFSTSQPSKCFHQYLSIVGPIQSISWMRKSFLAHHAAYIWWPVTVWRTCHWQPEWIHGELISSCSKKELSSKRRCNCQCSKKFLSETCRHSWVIVCVSLTFGLGTSSWNTAGCRTWIPGSLFTGKSKVALAMMTNAVQQANLPQRRHSARHATGSDKRVGPSESV